MEIKEPGHVYSVMNLDMQPGVEFQRDIVFVKRNGPGYPDSRHSPRWPHDATPPHPGTLMQELLRVIIDRTWYVDGQIHDQRNFGVISSCRAALRNLEERAAERHDRLGRFFDLMDEYRVLGGMVEFEKIPVCPACGHIGCELDGQPTCGR